MLWNFLLFLEFILCGCIVLKIYSYFMLFKNFIGLNFLVHSSKLCWRKEGCPAVPQLSETCCHHRWLDFRYYLWFHLVLKILSPEIDFHWPRSGIYLPDLTIYEKLAYLCKRRVLSTSHKRNRCSVMNIYFT